MENQNEDREQIIQEKEIKSRKRIQSGFWEFISGVGEFLDQMLDLSDDLDKEGTIANIKNNKRMQGANVWLLMCSIMVASLGLDLNSPAVIIGAMLISPLMSPILGVGLGIGINDRETFYVSLQHFFIAIVIALITSVVYFWITPFGNFTDEIKARTVPTFLDACVAIFGGLAGIISSSRKDKSNAIPGVAIATALMPPLCVAGYGLVKGEDWSIFLNSFYLFFVNSVFIALTTYLMVRYFKFPYKSYINKREKQRTTLVIAIFSIIVLIPSAKIMYQVINTVRVNQQVEEFMNSHFNTNGRNYISHNIKNTNDTITTVFVEYYSKNNNFLSADSIRSFEKELREIGLINPIIIQEPTNNFQKLFDKQIDEIQSQNSQKLTELAKLEEEKNEQIQQLKLQNDSLKTARTIETIVDEAQIFVEGLERIDLTKSDIDNMPLLLIKWKDDKYNTPEAREKLYKFVKIKTQLDTLIVY